MEMGWKAVIYRNANRYLDANEEKRDDLEKTMKCAR